MGKELDQKIISKMYEDYDAFRKDVFEFQHQNPETQRKLEQFSEILEVIKTQQLMRFSEREELKNRIQKDIEENILLSDIDAIKDSLRFIDLTEKIDLFNCKELGKYLELINYLLGEEIEGSDTMQANIDIPKVLAQLVWKYDRSEKEEEKIKIMDAIKELPNQEFVQQQIKKWGIES